MASGVILLPSIESCYTTDSTRTISQILPALGPELIRHVIKLRYPQHDIRVAYGDHQHIEKLDDLVTPDDRFVGFSCTGLSYKPAIPLIREAQERGLPAIVGGVHPRLMSETILKRRPGLFVVTGPGEKIIEDLLNDVPLDEIEGLLSSGQPISEAPPVPFEFRPFLHETTDYSMFFESWAGNGVKLYRDEGADRLVAVRGITGCSKRKTCSFCTVQRVEPYDPEVRAKYLLDERRSIIDHFGERVYILDCSDSLPSQDCLEAMAKNINGDAGRTRVHSGAMVWELARKERFDAALAAGYNDFLVGLEGYARQHLPLAFKPRESINMLYKLLEESKGSDARYFVSGIIGWPGETEETLQESFDNICRILEYDSVITIAANFLMPMPGSSLYYDLTKQGLIDPEDDGPNMQDAIVKHVDQSCSVSLGRLQEFTKKVAELDSRVIQVWGVERERELEYAQHPQFL